MMYKISVVTVVLNARPLFVETAQSVISQVLGAGWILEWIVIDGGSVDGTLDEIHRYETHIARYVSEKDDGIYDAMNKGISLCTGDYIIFMNAGDIFSDETIVSTLCRVVDENEGLDVIVGGTTQVFDRWTAYRGPKPISWIRAGLPAFHQSTIYRGELLKKRPYNTNYDLLADYEWLAFMGKKGLRIATLALPISRFGVGGASYKNLRKKAIELYRVKHEVLKMSSPVAIASTMRRMLTTCMVTFLPFMLQVVWRFSLLFRRDQTLTMETKIEYFQYK